MARILRFKKIKLENHFPTILRHIEREVDGSSAIMKYYVTLVRTIARRSMRKAPRTNTKTGKRRKLSRFGERRSYGAKVAARKRAQGLPTTYWAKGQYSRPGQPPFWHGLAEPRTLRDIRFRERGSRKRWIVGPHVLASHRAVDVPGLHEVGGTLKSVTTTYRDRFNDRIPRMRPYRATYPARPYMKPALEQAKTYLSGGRKNFLGRLNNLGNIPAVRKAS